MDLSLIFFLIASHVTIVSNANPKGVFKPFKQINVKQFKPFKAVHVEPWPSLQNNNNNNNNEKTTAETQRKEKNKDKTSARTIKHLPNKKHVHRRSRLLHRRIKVKKTIHNSRRGLLDALKGANISIENHVHSVTVDTKPNKQQASRRGILEAALKGANISIENHVHSVTVDTKPSKKQYVSRKGLLDSLKGANISIENHVHSQTVKSRTPSKHKSINKYFYHENDVALKRNLLPERRIDVTGSKRDETFGDGLRLEGSNPMDVAAEIESNDKNLIPILTKENPDDLGSDDDDHRENDDDDEEPEEQPEYTISDKDDFPAERDPYFNERHKEAEQHHRPSQRDEHNRYDEHTDKHGEHNERDENDGHRENFHPPLRGTPDFEEREFPVNSYMKGDPEDHEEQSNLYMGDRWPHSQGQHEVQRADGNHNHPHVSREDNYGEERQGREHGEEQHGGVGREEYSREREHQGGYGGSEREGRPNRYHDEGHDNREFDHEREHDNRGGYGRDEHRRHGEGDRGEHYEGHHGDHSQHGAFHGNTEDPQRYHDEILYGNLHRNMGFHGNEVADDHGEHEKGHGDGRDGGEIYGAIHGERCITKKDGICTHEDEGDHHGDHHKETSLERMIEYQRNPFDPHDIDVNHHHDEDEHHHESVTSPIPQSVLQIGIDPSNNVHYVSRDEHHDMHYDNSLFDHHTPHHEGQYEGHQDGTMYHHNPHDDYEGEYSSHAVRITPHDNPHEYERREYDHPVHDHIHTAADGGNVDYDTHDGHHGEHGRWGHDEGGGHHGDEHDHDGESRLSYEHRHTYPSAPHQAPYVPIFTPPQRELPMFQVGHTHDSDHYHDQHTPGERRTKTMTTGQMFEFGNRDYASYLNQHLGDYLKQASYEYKVMGLNNKDIGLENVMAKKRKLENDAQAVLNETEILKQLHDNTSDITIVDVQNHNTDNLTTVNKGSMVNLDKQLINHTNQTENKIDKTIANFLNNADISSLLVESDKNSEAGVRRKNIPKNKAKTIKDKIGILR